MTSTPPFRPRLTHHVIVKAPGLLPMLYRPSELSEEFGVDVSTIRDWVQAGLVHSRDEAGHIWINGRDMACWVEVQRKQAIRPPLADDQAFCLRCRKAVQVVEPKSARRGRQRVWQGRCAECGAVVNRGLRNG
jgi:hypothetical protein